MAFASNSNINSKSVTSKMESDNDICGHQAPNIVQRSKLKDNKKHFSANSRTKSQISLLSENFTLMRGCHHFHYEVVDLVPIEVTVDRLRSVPHSKTKIDSIIHSEDAESDSFVHFLTLKIKSERSSHAWTAHRTLKQTKEFDRMLHTCIFQREISLLPSLENLEWNDNSESDLPLLLTSYFTRLTNLPTNRFNCSTILNYLELDNHGNQLIPVVKLDLEDYFNTPAKAAGHVIKEHKANSPDELNLAVGHLVSVLEMPRESTWWLGKSEMRLGYFPRSAISLIQKNSDQDLEEIEQSHQQVESKDAPVLKRRSGKFLTHLNRRLLWRKADSAHLALRRYGILQYRLFGCDLGELLDKTKLAFPLILTECCTFIENNLVVGVYRVGGEPMMVDRLRTIFDQDRAPNWSELVDKRLTDVHAACSVLKAYFRELPIPLLTHQLYFEFLSLSSRTDAPVFEDYLKLIRQLPPPNYRVLSYLVMHLYRISLKVEVKQTAKNLAIIWSQNMLKSPNTNLTMDAMTDCLKESQVIEYLIGHAPDLFDSDSSLQSSRSSADRVPIKIASADYPALLQSTISRAYWTCGDGDSSEVHHSSIPVAGTGSDTSSGPLPRLISLSEAQRRFASTVDLESTDESDQAAISPSSMNSIHSAVEPANTNSSSDDQRSALRVLKNLMTRSNSKKYNLQGQRPKSVGPVTILNANFLSDRELLDKFQPAPSSNLEDMTQPELESTKQSIPHPQPLSAPIPSDRKREASAAYQSKLSTRRAGRFFPLQTDQSPLPAPCTLIECRPVLSKNIVNSDPSPASISEQHSSLSQLDRESKRSPRDSGGDCWSPPTIDKSYSKRAMNETTRALLTHQNILRATSLTEKSEQKIDDPAVNSHQFTALKRIKSVNDAKQ